MSQTIQLIKTLKRTLKAQGITYAAIASHLNLSENSIKRLFAERSFSIGRLELICQLAGMELSDLFKKMEQDRTQIASLTYEQEQSIVENTKLLIVVVCLLDRWTVNEITSSYNIDPLECIQLLAQLDRLKIIELLPNNKVKVIVAKHFQWLPNGPIQKFFQSHVQADFFNADFQNEGDKLVFVSGMLSKNSNQQLIKKMERLSTEFNEFHHDDLTLPIHKRSGTSLVIAVRTWESSLFRTLRR